MAKIFITPVEGTARMVCGKVMTGGVHYAAVNKVDIEARNALALGYVTQLEGVELKDGFSVQEYEELYRELAKGRVREEGESATDYFANLVRFTADSLNSQKEDTVETTADSDVEKTKDAAAEAKKAAAEAKKAVAEAKKADEQKTGE